MKRAKRISPKELQNIKQLFLLNWNVERASLAIFDDDIAQRLRSKF